MREFFKQSYVLVNIVKFLRVLQGEYHYNILRFLNKLYIYYKDYGTYKALDKNEEFFLSKKDLYPCLEDKTVFTPLEPTYFFQDTWAARKIFEINPSYHYDVGSSVTTMAIISQFVPVTMIDIRPIDLMLNNFDFLKGSILDLPFEDNSIESISSLCVVEHIGLGRYGDPIDPWGSEKAIKELKRVLEAGGNLLITIPIDTRNRIYFNAHRAFTRDYIMELFSDMKLIEEKYIYGREIFDHYSIERGFGTGLFHFCKE